ncbi:CrcB family protein [Tessaracoccus sp. MC1865]|uniref:fluoride efflux transporter FluC n=1 Tax=Tessaracoccus sp. MC1865 TaxID=2760310 RepID=UPI00160340C4|nr:CrcB family protein [Tessaracoccus sp. MC1865]MBB1484028.1 CrcB family protein [Tessaracoccus sp. MC1865]QTO37065.1 CrcB family protein [Tessaracoccus sp. MC1865]
MIWFICLAGGFGAVARGGVDVIVARRWAAWKATLGVNLVGSFILGAASVHLSGSWLAVVGTGFCGAFTTFSSACWQAAREFGRRRPEIAVGYSLVTIAGCLLAAWTGTLTG